MTTSAIVRSSLIAALLLATACSESARDSYADQNVVNIYNWADYIGPDTVRQFEAEYGIKVNYDTYDSSEIVDVKLLAGSSGYDIVIHSNQFSSRLAPLGIFEKLELDKLSNIGNLDPKVLASISVYDKVAGYQVPYHWGTTGYAWNAEMVRERLPDHPMDSSDVLFDPDIASQLADCGVSLLDSPTDMFPMVLAYLGHDPTTFDEETLAQAEAQLNLVRPYIRYFSNQKMLSDLPNREVCVAMSWSGDFARAALRAEEAGLDIDLRYTMPKEGSGLWVDGIYVLSDAPHRENAYRFIDFVLRADVAADIANFVFYANANGASWQYVNPEILNNPAIFPDASAWERLYPSTPADPKQERPRTRAFARVKSGL